MKRQRTTLHEIERQVFSFSALTADVYVGLLDQTPEFKNLSEKLIGYAHQIQPNDSGYSKSDDGSVEVAFAKHDNTVFPVTIIVSGNSLNEIRHSAEYCRAEQTFLLVRDTVPDVHNGQIDDTLNMDSDLEEGYMSRGGPQSLTYDLLLGTIVFNFHFERGAVIHDNGKIASVVDFTDKVLVLSTTADAKKCFVDRARVDAPGVLGKTDGRSATFVPTRFTTKAVGLFEQAAGWHKIGPKDFTLRLDAANLP